eukprot:3065150-Prymnesium_polylepis.1
MADAMADAMVSEMQHEMVTGNPMIGGAAVPPAPLIHSLALLATALLVLLLFRLLWPVPPQPQLTWTLDQQGEADRSRIRRLILPTAALVPRDAHSPSETPAKSTVSRQVVRRAQAVSSQLAAATGLESLTRRSNAHSW